MTVASTLDVGPISTTPYDFSATRDSPSGTKGFSAVTFSGRLEQVLADALAELVVNPSSRSTIGGVSGVLAYIAAESAALVNYSGYYLLQSFESSPDGIDPDWPYVSFALSAVLIGDVAGDTPPPDGDCVWDGGY